MTAVRFQALYCWDVRHVGRSPLVWTILLILGVSFAWGAFNTSAFHHVQTAAHQRIAAREAAHDADIARLVAAYRTPVTPATPAVPYWQDPTNVSGFSQYQVFRHATKPHLPLSPLAVGVSDLAPSWRMVKLNTVAGTDDSHDFENPRGLALGKFDLGFALAYLLPVALILIFGLMVTFERDHGMLRLAAAQATSPRFWVGARMAAILTWVLPAVIFGLLAALALAGVSLLTAGPELISAILLVACYVVFWTGVAALTLSRLPSAVAGVSTLVAAWILLTLGLPIVATTLTSILNPAPSSSLRIDVQRRVADAVEADSIAILTRAFAARDDLRRSTERIGKLDHATKLSFLVPEIERRMAANDASVRSHADREQHVADVIGYAVPPLGFANALAILAGTDGNRQRAFEAAARAYQLQLR